MRHQAEVWIELAFPDLDHGQAYKVWHAIQKRASGCRSTQSTDLSVPSASEVADPERFQELLAAMPSMKLIDLAIGGVIVADAHMRAACEEQGEWVELSISARIVPRHSWGILSTQLYIFARSVSKEVCVARFAAGVDDWEDPSMRLFTNERVGPVAFGESGVTWGQQ